MSCCTNTYNLGCFNNCSIIAVGLCLTSGTYNGVFTYGNISTTITVTAIENEPFLFDLSLLNENATFTLAIYDENGNQITLTIDSVDYDCFKVKTQVDSVKVTQGTIIGCTPMCKEIYDPNDENTAVLFTVAVDGTTITGDGTVGNPLIAIGGGGGGGIESIVAGDNITIDNTDPLNPIISATDSASTLFPNGIEFVSASRDFEATDKGKLLILDGEVILTLPEIFPLEENDVIYIMLSGFGSKYQTQYAGNVIEGLSFGNGQPEVVKLGVASLSGNLGFIQLSESAFNNEKTALKYLYDKSQNAIPLSGTISGSPITGDIEFANTYRLFGTVDDLTGYVGFDEGLPFLTAINTNTSESMTATMTTVGLSISTADVTGKRGVIGSEDYSSNITDLDYTQKIYVDAKASSKQDTLVSGTNIKTINGTTILGSGDMTVGGQVDILQIQMFI